MQEFESAVEKEICGYIASYLHYETSVLRSLISSMVFTESPKALELRDGDRIALIYSEGGFIVHAVESHLSLEGDAYVGRDALRQMALYSSVNFREFKCDHIEKHSLKMLPEEIFDHSFLGESITVDLVSELAGRKNTVEMGVLMEKNSHNVFYVKDPANYSMLSQSLLNYCRDLLKNLKIDHYEMVDNIELNTGAGIIKKVLVKQFKEDFVLLFLNDLNLDEELLIPFADLI